MGVMTMADMVTTAFMARGLLMLTPTMATEDMVTATVMDMVMAMATATARDLQMPTIATEDTVDMVMDMVMAMATVMDTDTTDKKEEVVMMSRKSSVDTK